MANRYQSDDRMRSNPYRRQEEQFQSDFGQEAERSYGQMGDSWRDYGSQQSSFEADDRYGQVRSDRFRRDRYRDYEPYTGADFQSRERTRDRTRDAADRAADAFATGAGSQLAAAHGEWHEPASFRTGRSDYRTSYRGRGDNRGFFERAGDEIASWFDTDDRDDRRDRGYRGHGPSNYTRSDERIREDVNDRLTDDYRVDARNITATVSNGEVTLDGTVTSRDQKRRAEDVVEDLSGVKHVQNNLRVSEGTTWDRNNSGDTTL